MRLDIVCSKPFSVRGPRGQAKEVRGGEDDSGSSEPELEVAEVDEADEGDDIDRIQWERDANNKDISTLFQTTSTTEVRGGLVKESENGEGVDMGFHIRSVFVANGKNVGFVDATLTRCL